MVDPTTAAKPTRESRFKIGFRAPFAGIGQWFKRPALLKAGLPAFGIGIGLTAIIAAAWITQISAARDWLATKQTSGSLSLSWWAVSPSLVLAATCLGVFLLVVLGNLLAAPWQHRLVQATERELGADPSVGPMAPVPAAEAMLAELKRLGLLALWLLIGLALMLVPWIGPLLYMIWFWIVLVLFLAVIFISLPLKGRDQGGWTRARFIWRHKICLLGFGLGLMLLAIVPLVQVTCLPAAAVGAVGLVRKLRRQE